MANYSDIKGFTVQTLSTDTVASQFAGGAWASGGAIPVNINSGVGFGTQTAALVGGGYDALTMLTQLLNMMVHLGQLVEI